jgi:hypothetical protein
MIRACLLAMAVVLGGCSSAAPMVVREAAELPASRPADFTLAVTVHSPAGARQGALPRSLKAGRYVVEPDGSLRAALGERAAAYPGLTRQLTPEQTDQVWRLVRESGLLDPANPARVDDPAGVSPAERGMAVIYVSFEGSRRTLRVPLDRLGPNALAAERVVDRLAELGWVE